jgi:hypothetical protein
MQLPLTGACQCRNVRYEIGREPLTVYVCHCTECQRQSASAFSLSMIVLREAVAVVAGEPSAAIVACGSTTTRKAIGRSPLSNRVRWMIQLGFAR